jgi:hypothetical protein
MEVDDEDFAMDEQAFIGHDLVEEYQNCESNANKKGKAVEPLTDREINIIQEKLQSITRPTWHRGPPTNLGEAEHGKLKAEQWRSSIEFDLPVILYQLWGSGMVRTEANAQKKLRREALAHSTMLLAIAIRWGTSHVTSRHHAEQYMKYMKAYLACLQDNFPGVSWRPNHHASLHMNDFLLRYGPMHGWWMFPFERIIGALQKTNTNNKIGKNRYPTHHQ